MTKVLDSYYIHLMGKIRILVADDHPIFQDGLCQLLEGETDLEVIAKSADGEEAVKLSKELMPDVVVLDVAMPKLDGIEAAKQIKAACPDTAILILSAYSHESHILTSLKVGIEGYLMKGTAPREVVNAVHSVYVGEAVYDLKTAGKILQRLAASKDNGSISFEILREREVEILKLAAKGLTNKEIAEMAFISERTVQTHMINIFRKLKVGSRTEAVLYALKKGWLNLNDIITKE